MKKIIILVLVAGLGAFLWWTISPLFINKVVEDELDPEIAELIAQSPAPVTNPQAQILNDNPELKDSPTTSEVATDTVIKEVPEPEIVTPPQNVVTGPFAIVDTPGHRASGNVRIIETDAETIVRYENYDGTNGPDLKIYLANDLSAKDFLSLGEARGNQGNINYTVPAGVDVSDYRYVLTWCEAFGVLFDYAEIN